jgi:hypothetical protein
MKYLKITGDQRPILQNTFWSNYIIFWHNLLQFSTHKFKRRKLCQNLSQKTAFCLILNNKNHIIGLKNGFGYITPTPQFWRWLSKFYRIGSTA